MCFTSFVGHKNVCLRRHKYIYVIVAFCAYNISVTMDDFCPSLAIQVSPNPTPAEIIIITVGKRNGIFQVSLGNGEGAFNVW